jgi:hypothetical protein
MHVCWGQLVDANLGQHEVFDHFEEGLGHDIFLPHLHMGSVRRQWATGVFV